MKDKHSLENHMADTHSSNNLETFEEIYSVCAFCKKAFLTEKCLEKHIGLSAACKNAYNKKQEPIYLKAKIVPILPTEPNNSMKPDDEFKNLSALLNDVVKELETEMEELIVPQSDRSTYYDELSTKNEIRENPNGEHSASPSMVKRIIVPKINITIDPETGRKRYYCNECPRSFMSKNGFEAHVKIEHYGEKRFSCPLCKREFLLELTLNNHVSNKTCEKAKIRKLYRQQKVYGKRKQ